jgi:hypothetical protein
VLSVHFPADGYGALGTRLPFTTSGQKVTMLAEVATVLLGATMNDLFAKLRNIRFTGEDWSSCLMTAIALGFAVVTYYGLVSTVTRLTAALFLGAAALVVGVFLGFLFGIPRSLQTENPPGADPQKNAGTPAESSQQTPKAQYKANTNLEQISDWLTKILVGVGLTQLNNLPDLFVRAGDYFGSPLGNSSDSSSRIAIAIILFFSICGFLFGYLWTRLFLGRELAIADFNSVVREFQQARDEQSQIDAKAIGIANQYLTGADISKISVEELKDAIDKASPPVKVQVFYLASDIRSKSWRRNEDKPILERTIPIFESLVASDKDKRFHQNYGQLGFALKDKRKPDYAAAEAALSAAIDIRGSATENGWQIYELNRAFCRIKQDEEFIENKPSKPDKQKAIRDDLDVAKHSFPNFFDDADIVKWLQLNP